MDTVQLEKELFKELVESTKEVNREYRYYSGRFFQMLDRYGSRETVKKLINSGNMDGFDRLKKVNALQYSVEAIILQEKYKGLFTDEELDCCRKKLERAGYTDFKK